MTYRFIYILCSICIYGCTITKSSAHTEKRKHNATVGIIGGDCGASRLLTLYEEDGKKFHKPVYEINLPDSLRIEGTKLHIKWRNPIEKEMMICHARGPGYSQIFILEAIKIE